MKKIFFDHNCFKDIYHSEESIVTWFAYKEEFKDLKDFSKFCINDDLKESISCEADRINIVNERLLGSYIISSHEFFKHLYYLDDLKDSLGVKLPCKIKEALHIESEWDYRLCTAVDEECYYGEPAVSYYIEDNGTKILLDVGYSDLFIKNAINLGVNLNELDYIVISHGHNDHTGGLKDYFENYKGNNVSLIAHPEALNEKFSNNKKISSDLTLEELNNKCNLLLSKKPKKISDNIIFLGEIPNSNDFENRKPIGVQLENGILKMTICLMIQH